MLFALATTLVQAAARDTAAPQFTLPNSHHQQRTLSDYKGKVVLINFWASWCAPCQAELPELKKLAAEERGRLNVLAINVDENRASAEKLLAELGLDTNHAFEILWDTHSEVVSTYNIESMPSSVLLDSRGRIRFVHVGFHRADPALWRREITQILQ